MGKRYVKTTTYRKQGAGFWKIMLHLFLTLLTGGLWLVGLIIWYVVKK